MWSIILIVLGAIVTSNQEREKGPAIYEQTRVASHGMEIGIVDYRAGDEGMAKLVIGLRWIDGTRTVGPDKRSVPGQIRYLDRTTKTIRTDGIRFILHRDFVPGRKKEWQLTYTLQVPPDAASVVVEFGIVRTRPLPIRPQVHATEREGPG